MASIGAAAVLTLHASKSVSLAQTSDSYLPSLPLGELAQPLLRPFL